MSLNVSAKTNLAQVGKEIDDFSKRSRIALTQLSLVAQDLPYGFIGIQNNIPGLISSFSQLDIKSKGLVGVLKEFGDELIGPTGILFAVSAITAGLTALIQKYGSLTNAVNAITGNINKFDLKVTDAKKSYDDFSKSLRTNEQIISDSTVSVQAQIIKVNALSEAVTNNKLSSDEKRKAIIELKKVSDQYFGGLSDKKIDLEKLKKATDDYTQSLINQAIAKGYTEEITAIVKEQAKQERILLDLVGALPNEYAKIKKAAKDALNVGDAEAYSLAIQAIPIGQQKDIDKVNQKYFEQANRVTDLRNKFESLKKLLSDITLKNLKFTELPKPKPEVPEIIGYITLAKQVSLIDEKRAKELRKLNDELELNNKLFKGAPAPDIKKVISPEIFAKQKEWQEYLKQLQKNIQSAANIISGVLIDPLTNLFENFLNTGKLTFKEFGKAVLENLKKLTAQIIATGIIQLLATILSGGFGATAGLASGTTGFAAGLATFGKAIASSLGFKTVAAPSFGGVGPGGLAMSGAVSLSLRGSDLVGALNRTNTNINRIG